MGHSAWARVEKRAVQFFEGAFELGYYGFVLRADKAAARQNVGRAPNIQFYTMESLILAQAER